MQRPTPTQRIEIISARLRAANVDRKTRRRRRHKKDVIPSDCPRCKNDPKRRAKPWCTVCFRLPTER